MGELDPRLQAPTPGLGGPEERGQEAVRHAEKEGRGGQGKDGGGSDGEGGMYGH